LRLRCAARQGRSGLGLEAQREKVKAFLDGGHWQLTQEFVEVESGRRNDRPELAKALDACRKTKARLIVATMSRLTRDTRALLKLKDDKVDVVFCDLPEIPPGAIGAQVNKTNADRFAANIVPIIAELQRAGAHSLAEIAAGLDARGIRPPRADRWSPTAVANILKRSKQ
jgi:hypothetical protein